MRIGFIGVGNMGGPMCRNIIKSTNHDVVVLDLNPDAMAACTSLGAARAASVAELAAGCEVILTSLPTPRHVEEVALGPGGIGESAKPGTIYIDLSTNSPATARRVHAALSPKGITLLEAPVTGGVARATEGTIVIMVGGDEAAFETQRPLLASFSSQVVHVGPVGAGSVAKLVNNMLALCNMAVAAEGLMIGAMAGVDLTKLNEIISNGSGNSFGYRTLSGRALAGDFKPSFALDLAYKDMRLALELAEECGVPGLVGPQVLNLMRMARAMGLGTSDCTSIIKVYEGLLGREARV